MTIDAGEGSRPARDPRRRPWRGAAMKIIRRVHMYLGLLLFPWVLLFGITGMLFNHPQLGRDIRERALSREEISTLTGLQPWDPDAVARRVVEQLNAGAPAGYTLDTVAPRTFSGWPLLATPSREGGRHVLIVNLKDGGGTLATHAPPPSSPAPPFAGANIDLPEYKMAAVQEQVKELLPKVGIDASAPLRAHPKVNPELHFRMRDASARAWRVTYNLTTGQLDGRPDDETRQIFFAELLGNLHTTHHYPVHKDMTWLWALFADLTGITLVLWALTGLIMWWQMKPTRVIGALAIVVAVGIAAIVMLGTSSEIQFGNLAEGP